MEPPGGIPPDRDKYSIVHQQPGISTQQQVTQHSHQQHAHLPSSHQQQQPQSQHPQSHQKLQQQQIQQSHNTSLIGVSATGQQSLEKLSRPMAFDKMEALVREMQDPENGVPVRQQKMFLTSIPYAFMGYDLIEWLMDRLSIEESEALNLANQLCLHGYFFPVNDTKSLIVKDDSSLYRFQTPYYWPWQHKAPDNVEYAIYLAKRSLRNKQRHGLEDYESEALASLHKNLKGKWDFISMQAEEQVRLAKERKKGDKIVGDSQERAYWRVHRPPPGQFTPLEPCPVPSRDRQGIKPKKKTLEDWQREVDYLKKSLGRTRMKMSQACESLVNYWETFADYDFFIQPVLPSNPWVSEDVTFWQLNNAIVDIPTEKRVRRWAISIEELVSDPTGLQEFTNFLEKEYSHENIRFWIAVNRLRRSAHSQVAKRVQEIYEEFLKPGAPCEINIDGKTMEIVQKGLKNPSRFTFDAAAEHIYMLLLKKDCYPRFIRSEHYKSLLASGIQPSHKKRFFNFGGVAKKKSSTVVAPNQGLLGQSSGGIGSGIGSSSGASVNPPPPPGNLTRRRGSDRSLTGSAHELAVISVKDATSKVPHSHSQSNLTEIPYSVTIYRGDMPTEAENSLFAMDLGRKGSTSSGFPIACPMSISQEGVKQLGEKLESTSEAPGSCAVCPWETQDPVGTAEPSASTSAVRLSVCPWDEDSTPITTKKKENPPQKNTSTSSDISEVSERMRRSCGLRQNTVDSDYSTKRLMPNVSEQRRASMTMSSRTSEFQFAPRQGVTRASTTPSPTIFTSTQQQQKPAKEESSIPSEIDTSKSNKRSIGIVTTPISEAALLGIAVGRRAGVGTGTEAGSELDSNKKESVEKPKIIKSEEDIDEAAMITTLVISDFNNSNNKIIKSSPATAALSSASSSPSNDNRDENTRKKVEEKFCEKCELKKPTIIEKKCEHLIIKLETTPTTTTTDTISTTTTSTVTTISDTIETTTNINTPIISSTINTTTKEITPSSPSLTATATAEITTDTIVNKNNDESASCSSLKVNTKINDSCENVSSTSQGTTPTINVECNIKKTETIMNINTNATSTIIATTNNTTLNTTITTFALNTDTSTNLTMITNINNNDNTIATSTCTTVAGTDKDVVIDPAATDNVKDIKEVEFQQRPQQEEEAGHDSAELMEMTIEERDFMKDSDSIEEDDSKIDTEEKKQEDCSKSMEEHQPMQQRQPSEEDSQGYCEGVPRKADRPQLSKGESSEGAEGGGSLCDEAFPQEELSPTTEEYQECAQFGDQGDVYEYDIADIEANLKPGYVAPAPTPAPSLAPLAEIEGDPEDLECSVAGDQQQQQQQKSLSKHHQDHHHHHHHHHHSETEEPKSRRKKRGSDAKKIDDKGKPEGGMTADEAGASTGTDQEKQEGSSGNPVCPWEDEDVTASDTTFVKTYATLGYL